MNVVTNGVYSLENIASGLTANGKTIFLVKTMNGSKPTYTAYTGIKEVPTITVANTSSQLVAYYAKASNLATVVYIDATGGTVVSSDSSVIFIKGNSNAKLINDSVKGKYYTYDAVVNGEITTIDVASSVSGQPYTTNQIFDSVSYDSNGVATGLYAADASSGVGVKKVANDVVEVGNKAYVLADDCKVFYLPKGGNLQVSSVSAITDDSTDEGFYKRTNNAISTLVIVENVSNLKSLTGGEVLTNGTKANNSDVITSAGSGTLISVANGNVITIAPTVSPMASVNAVISDTSDLGTSGATSYTAKTGDSGNLIFDLTIVAEDGTSASKNVTITISTVS